MTPTIRRSLCTIVISLTVSGTALPGQHLSVREVMESALTPATNTLWGVEEPLTDDDWQHLDDAAIMVIASMSLVADGGTGPADEDWAAEAEWQAWCGEVIEAAEAARVAIASRDLDALLGATDAIYPPCETCHMRFHPGVQ